MRTLKEIREYCENLPPSRFKVHETGLEAGGITYVESGEYTFDEEMIRVLVSCSEDLPRLAEWAKKARYWIGRHVVPLTVNKWEQEEIRKLLKEIEG